MAEVLIVTAIIGVIGALTIPNIKKSYEAKANIAKAKSAFNKLDSALRHVDMNEVLNGKTTNEARSLAVYNAMTEYLKLAVSCGTQTDSNYCFTKTSFTDPKGFITSYGYNPVNMKNNCSTGILNDGTEFALCITSNYPNSLYAGGTNDRGFIFIDVDGAEKGANTRGIDIFMFCVGEEGLKLIDATSFKGPEEKIFIDNDID